MTVEQVEALDLRFTPFVNRLLDIERRTAGLSAHLLTIAKLEDFDFCRAAGRSPR